MDDSDNTEPDDHEHTHDTSSRRSFLRRLGVTFAAAVGAGTLAKAAFATLNQCCYNCSSCGQCDTFHPEKCYCLCDCGSSGSYCWTVSTGCLTGGCVGCPC